MFQQTDTPQNASTHWCSNLATLRHSNMPGRSGILIDWHPLSPTDQQSNTTTCSDGHSDTYINWCSDTPSPTYWLPNSPMDQHSNMQQIDVPTLALTDTQTIPRPTLCNQHPDTPTIQLTDTPPVPLSLTNAQTCSMRTWLMHQFSSWHFYRLLTLPRAPQTDTDWSSSSLTKAQPQLRLITDWGSTLTEACHWPRLDIQQSPTLMHQCTNAPAYRHTNTMHQYTNILTHQHTDAPTHWCPDTQTHRHTATLTYQCNDGQTQWCNDTPTYRCNNMPTYWCNDAPTYWCNDMTTYWHNNAQRHRCIGTPMHRSTDIPTQMHRSTRIHQHTSTPTYWSPTHQNATYAAAADVLTNTDNFVDSEYILIDLYIGYGVNVCALGCNVMWSDKL